MRRQPVATGTVADLVMVLGEDNKLVIRTAIRMPAEDAMPVGGIHPVINIGIPERLLQMADLPEIGIVGIPVAGEQRPQGVMEFVDPLPVQAIATLRRRMDVAR